MELSSEVINNENAKRYELTIDNHLAKIEYILTKDKIYLTHTEVPKALEGRGIAKRLVLFALEDIEKRNLKLIPLCPFVAAYLKRNPKWLHLVDEGINIA